MVGAAMFKKVQFTSIWKRYLGNHVAGLTTDGCVVDPLGMMHAIESIAIDEDTDRNLKAVCGNYSVGGMPCCFYSVPLSHTVFHRGRVLDSGYIEALDLYWFEIGVFELKRSSIKKSQSRWELSDQHAVYWASGNKYLRRNIEMYSVVSDALLNNGYTSTVSQGNWILSKDSKSEESEKYRVHKVLIRTKNQKMPEYLDAQGLGGFMGRKDVGGFMIEAVVESAERTKQTLYIEYPTDKIKVPKWELIHDA